MLRLSLPAVATLVVLTGCGSGTHFRLGATRSCLNQRGFKTSVEDNWIFKPTNGALVVEFGRRYVALNFGKDEREARNIRDAALEVNSRWPIAVRGSVAYVWSVGTKGRVKEVVGCLRG